MSNIQDMINKLIDAVKNTGDKTSAYDTSAEVKRIEGDTAWVHIPGGVDETPVKMTIAANEGDTVQVRVNGGRAWIQGNATAPPTSDRTAIIAQTIALEAQEAVEQAVLDVQVGGKSVVKDKIATIPTMTGATDTSYGKAGLVPAPERMRDGHYSVLIGDGTWKPLTGSTYKQSSTYYITLELDGNIYKQWEISSATQSLAGVMSSVDKTKLDSLCSVGSVYETTDSTVNPASLFGGTWSILGQLKTSSNVEIMASNNEKIYAAASGMEPERTYKWVRIISM